MLNDVMSVNDTPFLRQNFPSFPRRSRGGEKLLTTLRAEGVLHTAEVNHIRILFAQNNV